jgi:DNA-binding transcriptional regulator PaaX
MKSLLKVQLQHNKKLDKMFWQLLEQNQEVKTQIQNYKEVYEKAQQKSSKSVVPTQAIHDPSKVTTQCTSSRHSESAHPP